MQARKNTDPEVNFYGSGKWFAETLLQGFEEYRTRITGGAAIPLVDSNIIFEGDKPILNRFMQVVETALSDPKCVLNQPSRYGRKKELPLAQGCSEEDAVINGNDFAWWATMEALPLPKLYRDAFEPPLVDWHYWMSRDAWTVDEAVNLICDIEPGQIIPAQCWGGLNVEDFSEEAPDSDAVLLASFEKIPVIEPERAPSLQGLILAAVATGNLPCSKGLIVPRDLINWCCSKGIEFPVVTTANRRGSRPKTATEAKKKSGRKVDKERQKRDRRIFEGRQSGTSIDELAVAYNCTSGEIKAAIDRARKRKERQRD